MFEVSVVNQLKQDAGAELLPRLFEVFSKETESLAQQVSEATELTTETVRLCHSLKSSSKTYGAFELAKIAEQLETLAKTQQQDFFVERDKLPSVVSATIAEIPNCLSKLQG